MIRLLRSYVSQKNFMHSWLTSTFRSPITIKLSYFVEYRPKLLLRTSKWFVIFEMVGIVSTAQQPVFLRRFSLIYIPPIGVLSLDKCLAGISSLTISWSPAPYWSRSLLKGVEKPGIFNCSIGKKESSFASDINKLSTFAIIWLASRADLFLIELMFHWTIMIRFKFSCPIILKFYSETWFVKPFIPDASTCWDPYSVWKFLTQLKSSRIQNDDGKYFIKLLAKTEFPCLFRWSFLFPNCSSSMLLLSITCRCFCWQ